MNYAEVEKYLSKHQFTWLITGVAGFIGSNLMKALLTLQQKVIGLDNFATGYKRNIDEVLQNVSPQQAKNFVFHEGDICSFQACEQAMLGVDYVLHQAALGSVPRSIKDPLGTNAVNVDGFLNVLCAAKNQKVKRFIYASSSSVYGDSKILPKVEDAIGRQLSPYASSKYANELYANAFSHCYDIETIGLRYFNVFGPHQDSLAAYSAVIPLWFKAMLNGEPIYINGDGETTRDFCYVENVIQANLLAALADNSDAVNTVYNIAVGEQISLSCLFETIRSILNISESYKPKYREGRVGDIRHSLADINKAKNKLNYEPKYNVRSGLSLAAKWYIDFFNNKK
ncbi:MAG: SDR family oxidoreductase [bacterium]